MAEVYLGRKKAPDGRLGPSVALKRLLPHLINDSAIVRMFLNEARITAQVVHPNVVRILDLGQVEREPFIAMELLEGRSLADLRQVAAETGQRMPVSVFLRVLAEACRGLDAAHRALDENGRLLRVVHRDFSPDNIHVGVDGSVKVIDFGIATASNVSSGTEPGTLKGKFFYMSPEMIAGTPVDHRADLFAAGVMLYEQLCGRRPFTGLSTDEVLTRIAEGRPRPPSSFDPSVPPPLEAICLTALSHHPDGRFPSLKEFIDALESVGAFTPLASPMEVGSYVERAFPEDRDPQRQRLRQARQQDPSIPYASFDGHVEGLAAETNEASPTTTELPAVGETSDLDERPLRTESPEQLTQKIPTRKRRPIALWAVGGLVLVLLVGLIVFKPWARGQAPNRIDERHAINELLTAHEGEKAMALIKDYLASYPNDVMGYLFEARAYMLLRQGKKADAALDRAAQLTPDDPAPDLLRAELRQIQGDPGAALDILNQALKKKPHDHTLQYQRGLLLSQMGRLDDASVALTALIHPHFDAPAAAELAFVKMRQTAPGGDLKEVILLLRKALRREPELEAAHYYLGTALALQGDSTGAEHEFRKAEAQKTIDVRPLSALCQLQVKSGRAAEAETTKQLMKERFPDQATALLAECRP
jgi:serine/threonine protein kinase